MISTNDEAAALLDPLPEGVDFVDEAVDAMDAVVLFVEDRESLIAQLDEIIPQLGSTPVIWIGYPEFGTPSNPAQCRSIRVLKYMVTSSSAYIDKCC